MNATLTAGMSNGDYQKSPGLSATAIKAGAKSMLHMRNTIKGLHARQTKAFSLGTAIHAAILEPEKMIRSFVVDKDLHHSSNDYKAWKAEQEKESKQIVSRDALDIIERAVSNVRRNKRATMLLDASLREVSIHWTDGMLGACKARLDGLSQKFGMLEVKSTAQISPRRFGQQFFDLGYDMQAGWYTDGAGRLEMYDPNMPVNFLVVDSTPDADCYCLEVPQHIVEAGREKARLIANMYRACESVGIFAGVAKGDESLPLEIPAWIANESNPPPPDEEMSVEDL